MLHYDLYKIDNLTYKVDTSTGEVKEIQKEYIVDELYMSSDVIKRNLTIGDSIMAKLSPMLKHTKINDIALAVQDEKTKHYLQLEKILDNNDIDRKVVSYIKDNYGNIDFVSMLQFYKQLEYAKKTRNWHMYITILYDYFNELLVDIINEKFNIKWDGKYDE